MLDFMIITTRDTKRGTEVYPKFVIKKSTDLMIRGGDFYAIWDEERGLWSTDEQDALRLIDISLDEFAKKYPSAKVMHLWDAESGMIDAWHKYCQKQMRDNFNMLDEKLVFSNSEVNKKDFASKRLPYPLEEGTHTAWDKLISTLYTDEERHKIEWAIGSIVSGDSKHIQKFMVLYGAAGTGKSTILNVIQQLFDGYYSVFDAKALGSSSNSFALEAFKTNPLVAIQHDGDLSRIEDNTRLNSLVSHELMTVNEKFKSTYSNRFKSFLFMGTNKPVKITDGKSGLLRRLIDVTPSGKKLNPKEYKAIMNQVQFELGAIASHCRDLYLSNPGAYDNYIPTSMMSTTNDFYNFVIDSFHIFKKEDGTTLKAAYEMYKVYCDEAKVPYPLSRMIFKEELKNYFKNFDERMTADDGTRIRSYYSGFKTDIFEEEKEEPIHNDAHLLKLDAAESIFDKLCAECPAQYATMNETPSKKWDEVSSVLSQIDTSKLHYVKVPENHIVIDLDIRDKDGNKCLQRNIEEASKWPSTYAEVSKGGNGIHLHYIYDGDVSKLSRIFEDNIEIKVFSGKSSLRRKLTKCNDAHIAHINSGLPMKGEPVVNKDIVTTEKGLRRTIRRCLNKEIHPNTRCNVDFIFKILEDAHTSGLIYDVSDMTNAIFAFAASSTNQADYCIKTVNKMHFKSEEQSESAIDDDAPLIFYDVEVFPNLFLVNWKYQGVGKPVVRMINPTPTDIEMLVRHRLIGFNCRRYDNHMLYACLMGYTNEQLYFLSQKIVTGAPNCFFGEAYNLSYTDVYDFAAKKQSLKKWEIELGIHHQELGLPWDQPVPEEMWPKVAEYCDNDVIATEAVFEHLQSDFLARQILADIAGMTVNDTTNTLTTRIIFGREKHPKLVYTNLEETFPGYEFIDGKNMYRDTDLGFGGYVYAEPGMYTNVALLDVASLHPHSIKAMNCFGEYTKNFTDLMDTRIFVKHKEYDKARELFGGKLKKYLDDPEKAKDLAQALKIAINSVYGLTSANFDNPFRDIRNKNNIVALRGALFMRTLQDEVVNRGYQVAHIKTDSIKIPNADANIINFCMEFARQYGYEFEHEATYEKMCLVNNAVYIAKYNRDESINSKHAGEWTATGTQFQIPYVFKTLFSKEPIEFEDMCETKQVSTSLYLDFNEGYLDTTKLEQELFVITEGNREPERQEELKKIIADNHHRVFIGKVGLFCPIKPGCGGAELVRESKDKLGNIKYGAATGAKGYRWLESESVKNLGRENDIDKAYYQKLVDDAVAEVSKYGDFEWFVSDDILLDEPPWRPECGRESCLDCPYLLIDPNLACALNYDISDLIVMNQKNEAEAFNKR